MIRLLTVPEVGEAHVIGSGPSSCDFPRHKRNDADLVVGVNDAAYRVSVAAKTPFIHLTADYPYARDNPVAPGALGVWVRHGEHPFPKGSTFPCWVPGVGGGDHNARVWPSGLQGVAVAGWGGVAGYSLACMANPSRIHLWGFDGGAGYERAQDAIEWAMSCSGIETVNHAQS